MQAAHSPLQAAASGCLEFRGGRGQAGAKAGVLQRRDLIGNKAGAGAGGAHHGLIRARLVVGGLADDDIECEELKAGNESAEKRAVYEACMQSMGVATDAYGQVLALREGERETCSPTGCTSGPGRFEANSAKEKWINVLHWHMT